MRAGFALAVISILTACGPALTPSAAGNATPSQAVGVNASGPRIAQPPITPPTPPGSNLPDFACAHAAGGKVGAANFTAARVGELLGDYDRFVLQFDAIVPTFSAKRQSNPNFIIGPSGQTVTLAGTAGVLVSVHSATGGTTFTGSNDILAPNYALIKEARQTQDFEGTVSWAIGLSQPACMRAFVLANPARLVIDFQLPSS